MTEDTPEVLSTPASLESIQALVLSSKEKGDKDDARIRRLKEELGKIFREGQCPCDKCQEQVPLRNNAGVFDFINKQGDWTQFFNGSRHLEPVVDEQGIVICEGSPSRWAMIGGLPDEREEYKDNKSDPMAQAIWGLMQKL